VSGPSKGNVVVNSQRGVSLIEVVIAIGLLGIVGVALANGLGGSSKALVVSDERTTAESLARTQMESIKSETYDASGNYAKANMPGDYDADIRVASVSDNSTTRDPEEIQRVVITIKRRVNGVWKPILTSGNATLEGFKIQPR
jgi:prepilin-type N-terminal cleavage/methylation domain-containing protein